MGDILSWVKVWSQVSSAVKVGRSWQLTPSCPNTPECESYSYWVQTSWFLIGSYYMTAKECRCSIKHQVTNAVNTVSRSEPDSWYCTKSLRCWVCMPSGPPLLLLYNSHELWICASLKIYERLVLRPLWWIFVIIRERLLSVEKPVETALLASLAGVKCFYGNQWHCRLKDNASKLSTILQGSCVFHFTEITLSKCSVTWWESSHPRHALGNSQQVLIKHKVVLSPHAFQSTLNSVVSYTSIFQLLTHE